MISEETVDYENVKPPTITLFASKSSMFKGWKEFPEESWSNLSSVCDTSKDYDILSNCINEKTFKLKDFLVQATSGADEGRDVTDSKYWSEDLSVFLAGKTFSLNHSYELTTKGRCNKHP